ncbi:efflux transporter periplasmic adaptor subunit [Photobacterium sanctipauli]|uniref:Efflux transporter periplasmic adaptor subunit n=2 Tax=Photobacterium sanctipauli TaxID=1342794 RepID=A0A2T3NRE5_9GAMM|nr:efflux RND transporter periplasmic adaptor subunit [Photobacterium sanctipauli]PSW18805.1 efflux transporter periplasmic adaptor subunit [Photobacterium sanctipauli]
MKQTFTVAVIALTVGAALGYFANQATNINTTSTAASTASDEPLYWVAPMDPNYKRDKPGKSPMGMDLIPVYESDLKAGGNDDPAGTVTISPTVENNLGVKTTLVSKHSLEPNIDTVGYVAFDESQLWQINSRVSGWIQSLNVNAIGEKVEKGEVLFELYSPELVRAQEELLNAKRIGKAVLVLGAKDRLRSLGVDNQQINTLLRRGKAAQNIAIKAPADGVIATLNVRNGAYLSPQQTVISGGSLDNIWVDAEVFERQAHWIKAGTEAQMRIDALPGQQWQGEVDYIYPILDPKTRTMRVRLKFSNPNGELKPNMFANLTLTPRTDEQALVVPEQAIIRSANMSRAVLALGEGKYRSVAIETGRSAGGMVEVVKGLSANEKVVTSAHFLIDSESSLSADFSRMEPKAQPTNIVQVTGVVRQVMASHNMLTIEHAPVPEWDWPTMTMDFTVTDESNLSELAIGQSISFNLEKSGNGQFGGSKIAVMDAVPAANHATMNHGEMDHSSMNHSTMDHGEMDHSSMDHSTMDHGEMDHSSMDHSTMDHSNMDHGKMGHTNQGGAQ